MYTERKYKVLKMCKIAAILLVSMYKHPVQATSEERRPPFTNRFPWCPVLRVDGQESCTIHQYHLQSIQTNNSEAQEEGWLYSQRVLPAVRAAVQQVHGGSGHGRPAEEGLQLQKEVKEVVASTILLHGEHQCDEHLHPAPRHTPRVQTHNQGVHLRACYRTDVMRQHQETSCRCTATTLARRTAICAFLREAFSIEQRKQAPVQNMQQIWHPKKSGVLLLGLRSQGPHFLVRRALLPPLPHKSVTLPVYYPPFLS